MPNEKCSMPNPQWSPSKEPLARPLSQPAETPNTQSKAPSPTPAIHPSPAVPATPATPATPNQSAIESHHLRRCSSYLTQTPGQPPIPRDETWKDECPCGQKLPCHAHGELWREVRYVKPWDPDYANALRRHNIPITRATTDHDENKQIHNECFAH